MCNLKITQLKRNIFETSISGCHVNFWGCNHQTYYTLSLMYWTPWVPTPTQHFDVFSQEVIPQLLTKEILTSVRVGAAWMVWPWVVEFLEEKLRKKTDSSVIVNQSSLFYIYKEENADTFQEICFLPRCRLEINSTLIIYPYEQPSGEVKVQGLVLFFLDVFTIKMHHHPSGILLFWSMSNLSHAV